MYCLSLREKNYSNIPSIPKGIDCLELRADLLEEYSPEFITTQIKALQKTELPIIFSLRSKQTGGKFPNKEEEIFPILHLAIELGCEYVETEIHWNKKNIRELIKKKGKSKIIAAFYNHKRTYSLYGLKHIARQCLCTKSNIIKIEMMAQSPEDNLRIFELIDFIKRKYKKPIIAYCLGKEGKLSQALGKKLGAYLSYVQEKSDEYISLEEGKNIKNSLT